MIKIFPVTLGLIALTAAAGHAFAGGGTYLAGNVCTSAFFGGNPYHDETGSYNAGADDEYYVCPVTWANGGYTYWNFTRATLWYGDASSTNEFWCQPYSTSQVNGAWWGRKKWTGQALQGSVDPTTQWTGNGGLVWNASTSGDLPFTPFSSFFGANFGFLCHVAGGGWSFIRAYDVGN